MVEKSELEDDERTPYSKSWWPRIIAMFGSIALVAIVFTVVAIFSNSAVPDDLPNIVFILVDDLGWNDVSFHGSPQIPTPNIDALAATGVVLNNYYTHSQCTPSRGALMSGRYANRLGLQHGNIKPAEASGLPLDIMTLADYMKKRNYKTHLVGKWHLGYHKKSYFPTRRGFDTFFGFLNDNIDYYDYTCYYQDVSGGAKKNVTQEKPLEESSVESSKPMSENPTEIFGVDLWENEKIITDFRGEYATDVFTNKAVSLIMDHDELQPLFLLISHSAVRAGNSFIPLQSPPDLYERNNHIKDENRRSYAGMITSLDESVGQVFNALYKKDMLTNSIIILSSDNGGDPSMGSASNWPLRGSQYTLWEGGVRSVGLIWSTLLELEKPKVSDHLMHISDWLPTLYYLAGGDVSDIEDIDGVNMWSALSHGDKYSPRQEVLLNIDPIAGYSSLRKRDWKLHFSVSLPDGSDWYGPSGLEDNNNITDSIDDWVWKNGSIIKDILVDLEQWLITENDTWRQDSSIVCGENFLPVSGKCDFTSGPCLYNITDDPCEYRNIAHLYPEIVEELIVRIEELNTTSLPIQSKDIDPMGDPMCHNFVHVPWMDDDEENNCLIF
ncbi:arylsulfatase B-like [Parasteatoda tepidariorum]|uniref:arylsulfatase B-like n=1 Tax=Parasteatoda tepidariorum TaxID=114398 RepID=UPI0039BCB0AA